MALLTLIDFPDEPTSELDIDAHASSVAAAAGGDSFPNPSRVAFWVKNTAGAPRTVTFAAQRACEYGFTHDLAVTVADGFEGILVKSFDAGRFNDSNNRVQVTYSSEAGLDVAAVRMD